eukprot:4891838-Pyramimonas_sp.AAC.1
MGCSTVDKAHTSYNKRPSVQIERSSPRSSSRERTHLLHKSDTTNNNTGAMSRVGMLLVCYTPGWPPASTRPGCRARAAPTPESRVTCGRAGACGPPRRAS